jgi:hypothetical protein
MRPHPLLFAPLVLLGCPHAVTPPVDTDLCPAMCQHIGSVLEGGLGCAEGQPVYDSTKPGEAGVPNESCTEFCQHQQANGVSINPRCVMQVTSCDQIEAARAKNCSGGG